VRFSAVPSPLRDRTEQQGTESTATRRLCACTPLCTPLRAVVGSSSSHIRLYCRSPQCHARDAMIVAAHTLDRRHAGAVCYNGRHFRVRKKSYPALHKSMQPSTTAGLNTPPCSLSFYLIVCCLRIQRRRCGVPVFPGVSTHRRFHRQAPGAATTTLLFSRCLFFHLVAEKKTSSNASQIRMHRTNPHCAHA
jgi:hypothetical protein